jgi:hypothetical protein
MAFLAFILTGDRYFADELAFWPFFNALGTTPAYRNSGDGLVYWAQVRGHAWCQRALSEGARYLPDGPVKASLERQVQANIAAYREYFINGPTPNPLHIQLFRSGGDPAGPTQGECSPWQDDFGCIEWVRMLKRGYDVRDIVEYKAKFQIERALGPCDPVISHAYRIITNTKDDRATLFDWAHANAATRAHWTDDIAKLAPGEILSLNGDYAEIARTALTELTDVAVPNAKEALAAMKARWAAHPPSLNDPEWRTLPLAA